MNEKPLECDDAWPKGYPGGINIIQDFDAGFGDLVSLNFFKMLDP